MASIEDLATLVSQLGPEEKQALAAALAGPTDAVGTGERSPEEQALDAKQAEIADLAGSEEAAADPGAVAPRLNQLHRELTEMQHALGHSIPTSPSALELSDRVQSLEIKVANLERAQIVITNEP